MIYSRPLLMSGLFLSLSKSTMFDKIRNIGDEREIKIAQS